MLLAPAFLVGAYIGYRRGWQKEAITTVGLVLAIAALWRGPAGVLEAFNALLTRFARIAIIVMNGDPTGAPPRLTVSPALEPIVTLALLCGFVVLAYLVGSRLGRRYPPDRAGRWYGFLVGGLNLSIIMSRLVGGLAQTTSTPPGSSGLNIRIPSFPGVTIVMPPPPESALLVNWPLAAVIVLLVSMLVYALVRMARA
jgi:hypothetical protein